MRFQLLVLLVLLVLNQGISQIAINPDGAPITDTTAMLEIKKGKKSKVKVRSLHYIDTAEFELSNRTPGNLGTDFLVSAIHEQGLFFSSRSDYSANTNDSLFTILTNGKVGIAKRNPLYKLDINGDINLNSAFRINGSPGLAGQVLTSTGTGAPAWRSNAFSGNTRFGVRFSGTGSPIAIAAVHYNLNTSDITTSSNSININKSGLYHFEGVYSGLVQGSFSSAPEFTLIFNLSGSSTYDMNLCTWKQLDLRTAVSNSWYHHDRFSIDMHLTAPAQLSFTRSFLTSTTPTHAEASVIVHGYLISE